MQTLYFYGQSYECHRMTPYHKLPEGAMYFFVSSYQVSAMHVANEIEPKEKGEPCPVKHLASTYLVEVDTTPLTKRFMRASFLLLLRQTLQITETFLSAHVSFDQTQICTKTLIKIFLQAVETTPHIY